MWPKFSAQLKYHQLKSLNFSDKLVLNVHDFNKIEKGENKSNVSDTKL